MTLQNKSKQSDKTSRDLPSSKVNQLMILMKMRYLPMRRYLVI